MNETTPFITEDGRYLFFSSNGHTGIGGLDIYKSALNTDDSIYAISLISKKKAK